jgi:hypothetical protein
MYEFDDEDDNPLIDASKELNEPKRDNKKELSFREFWESLPNKLTFFDYEQSLFDTFSTKKHIWILKATGLGITEFTLRWIAWKCLYDPNMKSIDVSVVIITGPRIELAEQLMDRLKDTLGINSTEKRTVCTLNGCRIEAFPSHHLASARGLNPKIVLQDESDFFPKGQQEEARSISERYIAKTNPHIIMVSTPNVPGGLMDTMEREVNSMYERIRLDYTIGLNKIYTEEQINEAKKSPTFEREYNLRYGYGVGDIFPYELVNACIETYPLLLEGETVFIADPAYGSSKFGTMGMFKKNGMIYVKEATQYDRPSPESMTQLLEIKGKEYKKIIIDSAHPGLIRDLIDKGVNALPVVFGEKVDPKNTLLSKMTIEAAQSVAEQRVRIHPTFKDLISQLIAIKFNEKGHPNKKELTFDLGDCFLMGINFLRNSKVTIIKV